MPRARSTTGTGLADAEWGQVSGPLLSRSTSFLEAFCFFGTLGGVTRAVGVGADASQLAALDDQVLVANRPVLEITLESFPRASRITGLGRQAGAGDMRGHAVVGHGAPRVIFGGRWREPDVTGITGQLTAFQRRRDGIPITELAASGVDQIGAALEVLQRLGVDHVLGFRVQRAVEGYHVTGFGQAFQG